MNPTRFKILLFTAVLLLVALLWHWISGWGLVTVYAQNEPLAKVLRSIEKQAGIRIVTNADPAALISMEVYRVPPVEAMDTVSAYLDGNWSLSYVAGPSKAEVINGIANLREGGRSSDYVRFGSGGWGGMMDAGTTVVDPRKVEWKVSPMEDSLLQTYLNQLSGKTGLMALVPQAWNPSLSAVPKGGAAGKSLRGMIGDVKGAVEEVFVLRVSPPDSGDRSADAGGGGQGGPPGSEGGFGRGGGGEGRREMPPEWMEERALARIEQLPKEEREQARSDFSEMRDFWQRMRTLPEAERRVEMEKFFNNPVVQEKIMDRMMSRDAKRSPERRAERFRRYIERKQQMKNPS